MRLIGASFLEVAGEAKKGARPAISVLGWPQKAYGQSLPIEDLRLLHVF